MLFAVALFASLLFSCTNNDSGNETYAYCIYSAEKLCTEGPFSTCQENGKLSNTCHYGSSPSVDVSSSSGGGTISRSSSSVGLSALPGGYGNSGGSFYDIGNGGSWWSSSEYYAIRAYYRLMLYYSEDVRYSYTKDYLFSVRCLQD